MTLNLSRDEARDLFGAYALGALNADEEEAVREAARDWPEGALELGELVETAALMPLIPEVTARPSIALEGRIIAEARKRPSHEQAVARARRGMAWWRRHLPHTMAAGFAAVAVVVGALWWSEEDPIPEGRWLPLETQVSEDPGGWVYVTDYERVPVSLLFWKTESPPPGTSYQLFRILADGETRPDVVFTIPSEGNAVIRIERQPDVALRGFAVVLIEGDEALQGTPTAESVVYTFPAR